jgi:formylglycine-generating enzyme
MRRAAGIALCLLSGCGLFPDLDSLSDSTCDGGAPCTGTSAGSGSGASGPGGTSGAASEGGSSGTAGFAGGVGGSAGAPVGGVGGDAGNGATAGDAGTGGSSAGDAGTSGSSAGDAGTSGSSAGDAGTSGAAGDTGTSGAAGEGGAAGSVSGAAGAAGSAGGVGGVGGAAGGGAGGTSGAAGAGGGAGGGGAGAGGTAACPSGRGPTMVRLPAPLGGGCIDSTEVTYGQYQDFLETFPDPTDQPDICAVNRYSGAYTPTAYLYKTYTDAPETYRDYALLGADWCDARAFCAWAGKSLCGKVGGGALAAADRSKPTDQWWLACSAAGTRIYPYKGAYDATACHTEYNSSDSIRQRPFTATCEGDVEEWTDSCVSAGTGKPEDDLCSLRGGSFNFDGDSVKCSFSESKPRARGEADPNGLGYSVMGFRCCSP